MKNPAPNTPDRLPPHSLEAEQGVLGCILLDPTQALSECAEAGLSGDWFYDLRHRLIWEAMQALDKGASGVDVLLVRNHLREAGDLDKVGGDVYLSELPDKVPSAANLPHYVQILEERHAARVLVRACADAVAQIYGEESADVGAVVAATEKRLMELGEARTGAREQAVKPVLLEVIDKVEAQYKRGSAQIVGITTGLEYFDKLTCGFGGENGNMIVMAGRPGTGKTSWALDVALHAAIDYKWFTPVLDAMGVQQMDGEKLMWEEHRGIPVGIFSLEMSTYSLVNKMLFQRAQADIQRWRNGFAPKADIPRILKASEEIAHARIWIDDTGRTTIGELRAKARRWVKQYGIKLFIIDYIQLMRSDGRRFRDDRVQELAEISGELQNMGKTLGVPMLILAQMNRDYEKEPNRAPRLSDLKDCGAIEQDADFVGFLYTPKLRAEDNEEFEEAMEKVFPGEHGGTDWSVAPRRVDLSIAKNRFGPTGVAQLLFKHNCTHFLDYVRFLKEHGFRHTAAGEKKIPGNQTPSTEGLIP